MSEPQTMCFDTGPHSISIADVVTFRKDGTVWVNPDLKPDEAARKMLEALKPYFSLWLATERP